MRALTAALTGACGHLNTYYTYTIHNQRDVQREKLQNKECNCKYHLSWTIPWFTDGETFHPTDVTDLISVHPNKTQQQLHKGSISALRHYKLKVRMLLHNKSSNKFCDYERYTHSALGSSILIGQTQHSV